MGEGEEEAPTSPSGEVLLRPPTRRSCCGPPPAHPGRCCCGPPPGGAVAAPHQPIRGGAAAAPNGPTSPGRRLTLRRRTPQPLHLPASPPRRPLRQIWTCTHGMTMWTRMGRQ